jgi:hypothetical protein
MFELQCFQDRHTAPSWFTTSSADIARLPSSSHCRLSTCSLYWVSADRSLVYQPAYRSKQLDRQEHVAASQTPTSNNTNHIGRKIAIRTLLHYCFGRRVSVCCSVGRSICPDLVRQLPRTMYMPRQCWPICVTVLADVSVARQCTVHQWPQLLRHWDDYLSIY